MDSHETKTAAPSRAALFPILEQEAPYLNHAAVGPWPRCTADAVKSFAEENMCEGSNNFLQWIEREKQLRVGLAQLTGASSPDDIALLKNTTEGICLVAGGLDWSAGDNIVLPSAEFPSNRLPWLSLPGPGVEAREVDIRAGEDCEAALISAMDEQTRLLAVSSVQWGDGLRLDIERLGRACHERGVLFFVDAIQQLGALPVDVEAAHVDFLAADAHKWLLAPEGIAVFYCREGVRDQLKLVQQGWHMVDRYWDFDRDEWTPSSSALRFEAGSPNSTGQAALLASVSLLLETGMDAVAEHVLRNTDILMNELHAIPGIRLVSRTDENRRSGIVSFVHERVSQKEIYDGLRKSGIACALREGAVRVSPHFYQDRRELGFFLERLAHIV